MELFWAIAVCWSTCLVCPLRGGACDGSVRPATCGQAKPIAQPPDARLRRRTRSRQPSSRVVFSLCASLLRSAHSFPPAPLSRAVKAGLGARFWGWTRRVGVMRLGWIRVAGWMERSVCNDYRSYAVRNGRRAEQRERGALASRPRTPSTPSLAPAQPPNRTVSSVSLGGGVLWTDCWVPTQQDGPSVP